LRKKRKNVDDAIQKLLKSFDVLCQVTKQKIFQELDKQVPKLKCNYQLYKAKLETFFNKDGGAQRFISKDQLVKKLNAAKTMEEYEFNIKDTSDSIVERSRLSELERKQAGCAKIVMKQLSQNLALQIALKPQPSFALNGSFDKISSEMKKSVTASLNQCFSLENGIDPLAMRCLLVFSDSKIIQSDVERIMVDGWVSERGVKSTLLYRGSRDGYRYQNFIGKVGSIKPTLTLVEATTNKRFGGFTDQDWTETKGYKQSSESFIFSISDQDKYPVREVTQGIHCNSDRLLMFGNEDIHLALDGHLNSNNLCDFGCSYDNKEKPKESLAGSKNFQIKELEVYQVNIF